MNVRPNKRLLPEHSCFAAVKVRFHVGGVAAVTAMLRNVENRNALLGVVALGVTTYCALAVLCAATTNAQHKRYQTLICFFLRF